VCVGVGVVCGCVGVVRVCGCVYWVCVWCVCVCNLDYPACNAQAQAPVRLYYILSHYLINVTIFGGGGLFNINACFLFSLEPLSEI